MHSMAFADQIVFVNSKLVRKERRENEMDSTDPTVSENWSRVYMKRMHNNHEIKKINEIVSLRFLLTFTLYDCFDCNFECHSVSAVLIIWNIVSMREFLRYLISVSSQMSAALCFELIKIREKKSADFIWWKIETLLHILRMETISNHKIPVKSTLNCTVIILNGIQHSHMPWTVQ